MSGGLVHEESEQHGLARAMSVTFAIDPETRLYVALPRTYVQIGGDKGQVPFVLQIGHNAVHMRRAEMQRLHDLLGRALAAHADVEDPS